MPLSKGETGEIGVGAKVTDPAPVKAYLVARTGAKLTDLNKLAWVKSDDIIGNAVKTHGGMLENYRNSGLG